MGMEMRMKIGVGFGLHKWIEFIFYLPIKIADIRKLKEYFFLCFLFLYLLITHFFCSKRKALNKGLW